MTLISVRNSTGCRRSWVRGSRVALLFLVVALSIATQANASSKKSSAPFKPAFVSKLSRGNVETIELSGSYSEDFWQAWQATFPPKHDLYTFDSSKDPSKALQVINAAFCFCLLQGQIHGFLPPALVAKLQNMPFDPKGPAAMVLRCLPIDPNVPPTPTTRETFFQQSRSCSCPVADTMVLGICRLLGILHGPKIPPQSHIVRDLMPTTKEGLGSLPIHRDYARQVGDQAGILWEPQFLILYCLRSGSARSQAATIVTDYQRLYQRISKNDRELLRKYKIQMKMQFKGTDDIRDLGGPFYSLKEEKKIQAI